MIDYAAGHYTDMHQEYLRQAQPQAFRAMQCQGTLMEHCRRRGLEAVDMRERLQEQMFREIADGKCDAGEADHVPVIVAELVSDFVRAL